MKKLFFVLNVLITYTLLSTFVFAQEHCPNNSKPVILLHHVYYTSQPDERVGSVAHKACYNSDEHLITEWEIDKYNKQGVLLCGCMNNKQMEKIVEEKYDITLLRPAIAGNYKTSHDTILTQKEVSIYSYKIK
jgi:hypothetical protein